MFEVYSKERYALKHNLTMHLHNLTIINNPTKYRHDSLIIDLIDLFHNDVKRGKMKRTLNLIGLTFFMTNVT